MENLNQDSLRWGRDLNRHIPNTNQKHYTLKAMYEQNRTSNREPIITTHTVLIRHFIRLPERHFEVHSSPDSSQQRELLSFSHFQRRRRLSRQGIAKILRFGNVLQFPLSEKYLMMTMRLMITIVIIAKLNLRVCEKQTHKCKRQSKAPLSVIMKNSCLQHISIVTEK
jgi:hypothetical protein